MNVVIYSTDIEPITVLDLPVDLLNRAAVEGKIKLRIKGENTPYGNQDCVLKHAQLAATDGSYIDILVTEDETAAMLAKPSWLPGQQGQVGFYKAKIKSLAKK